MKEARTRLERVIGYHTQQILNNLRRKPVSHVMPGTYTIEATARAVNDPSEWQFGIERQIAAYENSGHMISTQPTDEARKYYMIVKVDGTYEDLMDGLLEDVIQVTSNFYADDGGYFKLTDPEGGLVAEYDVRCTCGDHFVNEAIEWLKEQS